MNNKRTWIRKNSKIAYKTPHFKIYEDEIVQPDGTKGKYSYLSKSEGVTIVAVDNKNFFYLIKEFRYPINKEVIQVPMGVVEGGDLLKSAKRELEEETGLKAKTWKKLGGFYLAPGHEASYMYTFLATNFDPGTLLKKHEERDAVISETMRIPESTIKNMIRGKKIECGITLSSLMLHFNSK